MSITVTHPSKEDGYTIWNLVKESGQLDVNSKYSYFLLADLFSEQCAVAIDEENKKIVGFLSCLISPQQPNILFVWQICVHQSAKKQGVAKRMVQFVSEKQTKKMDFIHVTITKDNLASQALFMSLAKHYNSNIKKEVYITKQQFNYHHEAEYIYKIGPLKIK